jgi:predicted alpha/beta superfamily hydrolase
MISPLLRFFAIATLSFSASAQSLTPPTDPSVPKYTIDDTEVRTIRSTALEREYRVFVALPESYAREPQRRYPVVYVTDANYAFPLLRAISRRVGDHGNGLEDFILVGLAYANGDTPEYSRRRDYTPSVGGDPKAKSDMPDRKPAFGEAERYRVFLRDEVLPFVARHYRTDEARRTFAGHSFGGLLGAHILLTEPAMFERYVLTSPSLWWDGKLLLRRAKEYVAAHDALPAKVFMAIGGYETVKPGSSDPRYYRTMDMVADMRAFEATLKSRRYANFSIVSTVLADEDHLTVFPSALTRALAWALPPRR